MKNRFFKERGFVATDALIAIVIITIFTGLIATIIYNIHLANSSIKRTSTALSYITDVFEYSDKIYYEEVNNLNLIQYFNKKYYYEEDETTPKSDAIVKAKEATSTEEIDKPFVVEIKVQNYNETEGNEGKLDLVKNIVIKVKYNLGNKQQVIEMQKTKSREKLITPNKPDESLLSLQEGQAIYPIKYINNKWKICSRQDNTWYNYEKGNWATVFITSEDKRVDEQIDLTTGEVYFWIPKYAYNSENLILFLYSNTSKYLENNEAYNVLVNIPEGYVISPEFTNESTGIWTNIDVAQEAYTVLNSVYERKGDLSQ